MIKLNIKKKTLCWTWRTFPAPYWYRGVWSNPEWITAL